MGRVRCQLVPTAFLVILLLIQFATTAYSATNGVSQAESITFTQTGGPVGGIVRAFAIDPVNPQVLYVGSPGSSVPSPIFKSTDGGNSWKQIGLSIDATFIFHLTVDPVRPNIVYAALAHPAVNGLYKSTDAGESWTRLGGGISTESAMAITVDPRNSNILYLGTRDGKLFKSVDGGTNWVRKSNGLPTGTTFAISKIVVDPLNSNVVYLSTGWWDDVGGAGLYKTVDGGESWTAINTGLGRVRTFNNIAVNPLNPRELYATGSASLIPGEPRIPEFGVYKTVDGGGSWTRVARAPDPTLGAVGIAINPRQPGVVYVGWEGGLTKTSDGGATWQSLTVPPVTVVSHLLIDPVNPETVYAGTYHGGLLKSTDAGQTWAFIDTGFVATMVHVIAVDPNDANILYTGNMGDGVQISLDAGTTWRRLNEQDYAFSGAGAIAIHPRNSSVIYVGTEYGIPGRVYKTTDGGARWTKILDAGQPPISNYHFRHVTDITVVPGPPDLFFVSVAGVGIYKSVDGGSSWRLVNTGLTGAAVQVTSVKFDSVNRIAYAATLGGVFRSVDGGESWSPANSGLTSDPLHILGLYIDPVDPRILYAGAQDGKVFKTVNGASTWSQVFAYTQTVPFPAFEAIPTVALVIDPVNTSTLYVAYLDGPLFRSRDGGSSWVQLANLANFRSQLHPSLAVDAKGKTLYVGTFGFGLFRAVLSPFAEIGLSAPLSRSATPGEAVVHSFRVRNKGNVADRFDLSIASARGWRSEIVGTSSVGPLGPGEAVNVSVRVTIPAGTAFGVRDELTLRATSQLDPRVSSAISVATVVSPLPSTTTLALSASTITFGQSATLTGQLTPPLSTGLLTLQARPSGTTTWQNVTRGTPSTGLLRFTWTPPTAGSWELRATWSGDANYAASTSAVQSLTVAKAASSLALTVSAAQATVGSTVRLTVRLTPALTRGDVRFEASRDQATWRLIGASPLVEGGASLEHRVLLSGPLYFRASWPGDANHLPAQSPVVTIRVTFRTEQFTLTVENRVFLLRFETNATSLTQPTLAQAEKQLRYQAVAPDTLQVQTTLTYPASLLNGTLTVTATGRPVAFDVARNATHIILHYTHPGGTQQVVVQGTVVVPEFPAYALALLLAALTSAIIQLAQGRWTRLRARAHLPY